VVGTTVPDETVIRFPAAREPGGREPRDTRGRPMRDLRISVMDRCNFRCPYCMPRETYHDGYRFLKTAERLSFQEIVRLARLFVQLGVRKLRVTGGEPLLRANLADLIGDLTSIPGVADVALTTNGVLLAKYASELKAAGLKRVTVSLDSLDPEVFRRMSGGFGRVEEVLDGIDHARRAGLAPIKVNAVVQKGVNDHTVLALVEHFRETDVIVRFIEYMDVGNRNAWRPDHVVPSRELAAAIAARWPIRPLERRYRGEVSERYAFADGRGEIGFISSVSQPFCGDCSRARLSSDGALYTCLFATHGMDLRTRLRAGASDAELLELIGAVWTARTDRYSETRAGLRAGAGGEQKVEMFYIGG
jgi:GTP 3',8-cyclase